MKNELELIEELLLLTTFLEEGYKFTGTEAYPPFLEGTARKSYYYLYSLKQLASDEKNGDAVIDLSRSLLESMIVVMYVQEFGKEKKAKKFLFYAPVETWGDGLYAMEAGIELPSEAIEARKKDYEDVKKDYLRPTKKEVAKKEATKMLSALKKLMVVLTDKQQEKFIEDMTSDKSDEEIINKSWDGVDLETMMIELEKKGKFPGNLKESFGRIYTYGNRKNHLSATDIDMLIGSTERIKKNHGYHMNIGLYVSLLSYTKIMIELAKLRKDKDLKEKLETIEEKLLSMQGKEPKRKL